MTSQFADGCVDLFDTAGDPSGSTYARGTHAAHACRAVARHRSAAGIRTGHEGLFETRVVPAHRNVQGARGAPERTAAFSGRPRAWRARGRKSVVEGKSAWRGGSQAA